MNDALSINADYFLYGIKVGMIDFEEAIKWADSVIESCDELGGEIIELSLSGSRGRNGVMEALKKIPGNRNPQLAGQFLLRDLWRKLRAGADVKEISRKSKDVAAVTHQPDDEYYLLDGIDDEVWLAVNGTYGTLEQCRTDLLDALSKYKDCKRT